MSRAEGQRGTAGKAAGEDMAALTSCGARGSEPGSPGTLGHVGKSRDRRAGGGQRGPWWDGGVRGLATSEAVVRERDPGELMERSER